MNEKATKLSWKNYPLDIPKKIEIELQFTENQCAKLTTGLIPEVMEDKRFIYCENNWLYFHRSWTGFGLYKAQIIKKQEGGWIKEFWVERNQEKYKNLEDKTDIETFVYLIARGLL